MSDVQRHNRLVRLFHKHKARAEAGRGYGRYWCDKLADLLADLGEVLEDNSEELKREGKIK